MHGIAVVLFALLGAATATETWNRECVDHPVGFGRFTTGGAGGNITYARTPEELQVALCEKTDKSGKRCLDDEPRIIIIDTPIVFSEGDEDRAGCFFDKCGAGFQYSLDHAGTCTGREMTNVTIDKAGMKPLVVGSNKSILGKGTDARIEGKGLWLKNVENVIIRNVQIHNINPQAVWGGDALSLYGVNNVWIHKVHFKNVGRQFLVTYQEVNTGVTVSSCFFDGQTNFAPYCDGHHYWLWLFWGTNDQITLVNNYIYSTSGRGPHAGGWSGSNNLVHMVGNVFEDVTKLAIEPYQGASILAEGNSFIDVKNVINLKAKGGYVFIAKNDQDGAVCQATLGRPCLGNKFINSDDSVARLDGQVLKSFQNLDLEALNSTYQLSC